MESKGIDFSNQLVNFVDGLPIKALSELLNSDSHGVSVVAAWFDSVVEGVDMWFSDDQSKDQQRFRMKMKMKHGDHVAVFSVFDKEVQKLAMETCPLMIAMGEGCSLYPDEMECFYGDAYLFKVEKRDAQDFENLPSFKVTSLCNEVGVVDLFFDEYLPDTHNFVESKDDSALKELIQSPIVYPSSSDSTKGPFDAVVPDLSPSFLASTVVNELENSTASPRQFCCSRRGKISINGMGRCVETLVYSRRKTCVKRKLCFDDGGDHAVKKIVDCEISQDPKN